ncbi:MAG: TonB-dependent receptor [Saprospiraceae bacterium]|nr:TonB-dependent receptor [Saprospiraceae bacterium]
MSKAYVYIICLFQSSLALAQDHLPVDSALVLPEAIVTATSIRDPLQGSHQEDLPTGRGFGSAWYSLADLLTRHSNIYIKSYGGGGVATTSIRGGSASQTRVLWNGLPLENPMLGQMDFSLLPVDIIDVIRVRPGGQSAGWGNGAIAGVIHLDNVVQFGQKKEVSAGLEQGSFGWWKGMAGIHLGHQNWQAATRVIYQQAQNNFSYRIRPDQPSQEQAHAQTQQVAGFQQIHFKLKNHQTLSIYGWWQANDRNIPPTTRQNNSMAEQADRILRTAIHWCNQSRNAIWNVRAGYFNEAMDYQDPAAGLVSANSFQTVVQESSLQWQNRPGQTIQLGLTGSWHHAQATAYSGKQNQWRLSPFLGFLQEWKHWVTRLIVREEISGLAHSTFSPQLSVQYIPASRIRFHGQVSRNYRLPTLNDLYWQPGGNPDLLPESGWSYETGVQLREMPKPFSWSLSAVFYSRLIRNWILWSPASTPQIWSPQNISKVWSRGVEFRGYCGYEADLFQITLRTGYDYVRSTNEIALSIPLIAAGSQLVYVPVHQAFVGLAITMQKFQMEYRQHYTGPVSSLAAGQLPGYDLGSIGLSYRSSRPRWRGEWYLRVDNLWNADYRVVEYRPMPGISYRLGFHFQIINQKSN